MKELGASRYPWLDLVVGDMVQTDEGVGFIREIGGPCDLPGPSSMTALVETFDHGWRWKAMKKLRKIVSSTDAEVTP